MGEQRAVQEGFGEFGQGSPCDEGGRAEVGKRPTAHALKYMDKPNLQARCYN